MIVRCFFAASSINCSACATVDVNGFSTKTCFPFSRAALANSKWVQTGNVFPVLQGCLGQLEVGPNGRDHCDSVNLRRRQHFRNVARGAHTWIGALNPPLRGRTLVADYRDFAIVRGVKVPRNVRSPIAVTDNADSNHYPSTFNTRPFSTPVPGHITGRGIRESA